MEKGGGKGREREKGGEGGGRSETHCWEGAGVDRMTPATPSEY